MRSPRASQSGMSLVEVLVALFILALASVAIVMTLPQRDARIDREASRLRAMIGQLSDQAVASGEVRGLRLQSQSYGPEIWRNGRWLAAKGAHTLPDPVSLVAAKPAAEMPAAWPDIVADATGMVSAPRLTLQDGTERRVLVTDPSGRVTVER